MKIVIAIVEAVIFGLVASVCLTPIGGVIIGLCVLNRGLKSIEKMSEKEKKEEKEES